MVTSEGLAFPESPTLSLQLHSTTVNNLHCGSVGQWAGSILPQVRARLSYAFISSNTTINKAFIKRPTGNPQTVSSLGTISTGCENSHFRRKISPLTEEGNTPLSKPFTYNGAKDEHFQALLVLSQRAFLKSDNTCQQNFPYWVNRMRSSPAQGVIAPAS